MNIQERQVNLVNEVKALQFFYNLSSESLLSAIQSFDELFESSDHVDTEDFIQAQNEIDSEIEALCITHKISQECLEALMRVNPSFKDVVFA